jgi:hypothetical protein
VKNSAAPVNTMKSQNFCLRSRQTAWAAQREDRQVVALVMDNRRPAQQIQSGVSGVDTHGSASQSPINLSGLGQQNRKILGRNVGGRLFDIIDP